MRFVVALSAGLLSWSFVANLGIGDAGYVPRNLLATGGLLVLARRARLDHAALGVRRSDLARGLRWGAASSAAIAVTVAAGYGLADAVEPVGALLDDDRADLTTGELATAVLIRIPLGTALSEEVAFRGVLGAACRRVMAPAVARAWSSVIFGLWHIPPTVVAMRINDTAPRSGTGVATVATAVAVTTVAGVALDGLRERSGGLAAPVLAHWAVNAFGLVAAAARR
jgi:membrane protease YdiL (CAAX protease family)